MPIGREGSAGVGRGGRSEGVYLRRATRDGRGQCVEARCIAVSFSIRSCEAVAVHRSGGVAARSTDGGPGPGEQAKPASRSGDWPLAPKFVIQRPPSPQAKPLLDVQILSEVPVMNIEGSGPILAGARDPGKFQHDVLAGYEVHRRV